MIAAECDVGPLTAANSAPRHGLRGALVSLCWKAGFPARCALPAQTVLGHISPGAAIPLSAEGGWPLTEAEMRWQIELLAEPV